VSGDRRNRIKGRLVRIANVRWGEFGYAATDKHVERGQKKETKV